MDYPRNILLVEDDLSLGGGLDEYLTSRGYAVTWLSDERLLEEVSLLEFHAVVLDLILNEIPGEEILRRIREQEPRLPVLVLTAKTGLEDKQVCFEGGADDYLTKPFEPFELALRLQALCRREPRASTFTCGEVEIDLESRLVHRNGQEIPLSSRGWDLLSLLLQNSGSVVSKEEILDSVWSDAVVTDDVIRHYIGELRKIFPEGSIETYKGRGYRLKL